MGKKSFFDEVSIGEKLPDLRRGPITQGDITKHATSNLDYNPIHVDPIWCKEVNYLDKGTTIAHGMMTMGIMGTLLANWAYPHGGMIKNLQTKFITPVRPNDTLTIRGEVVSKHFREEGKSFVVVEITVENQRGETVSAGIGEVIFP